VGCKSSPTMVFFPFGTLGDYRVVDLRGGMFPTKIKH
jgi:hypothetical protein